MSVSGYAIETSFRETKRHLGELENLGLFRRWPRGVSTQALSCDCWVYSSFISPYSRSAFCSLLDTDGEGVGDCLPFTQTSIVKVTGARQLQKKGQG